MCADKFFVFSLADAVSVVMVFSGGAVIWADGEGEFTSLSTSVGCIFSRVVAVLVIPSLIT